MPGARCTRGPCALVESTRSSPRSHRDHPTFPHANGFNGFLRALPGDEFVFVTVVCGFKVLSDPVELAKTSANLTSATDARTTRLRRPRTRLRQRASPGTASLLLHASKSLTRFISPGDLQRAPCCRVHRIPSQRS